MNTKKVDDLTKSNKNANKCMKFTITNSTTYSTNRSDLEFLLCPVQRYIFEPNEDFKVTWYDHTQRNEVPDFLKSHEMPLELWQICFDRVNSLWMERNNNLLSKVSMPYLRYFWVPNLLLSYLVDFIVHYFHVKDSVWLQQLLEFAFFPYTYIPIVNRTTYSDICKMEDEIENAFTSFVSELNSGKCMKLDCMS
jgi:hypothetical protein